MCLFLKKAWERCTGSLAIPGFPGWAVTSKTKYKHKDPWTPLLQRKLSPPSRSYTTSSLEICQRGVLEIHPTKLRLTPPSPADLEHWRSLTELRERTDPEAVGANSPTAHAVTGNATSAVPTSAFLRVRILPSGPWEFSRTFPLKLPRPADWGRDPSSAGEQRRERCINGSRHTQIICRTSSHSGM